MKYLNFLVLLGLISCSNTPSVRSTEIPSSYRTSGVEQFFLAELPTWANFSSWGMCRKVTSFQYLDYAKLRDAYQLDYNQFIELQAQYNERLENYFRNTTFKFLKPVEEASFFSNTLEQVRAGIKTIKLPNVKKIEVIWLEGTTTVELKKVLNSDRYNEVLPVIFSSCHSKQSLAQYLSGEGMDSLGIYGISAEWLSAYSSEGNLDIGLRLDLKKYFEDKEVTIYPTPKMTSEIFLQ